MDSNKKNLIIGILGLVAGIAFVTYGVVNLMQDTKTDNNDDNKENDIAEESKITVTEDEVQKWLTDNYKFTNYFIDFETDFNRETAETADYSNFFGWVFLAMDLEATPLENSQYTYEYTISKEEIEKFLRDVFGDLKMDMFDASQVTLSKDYYNFIDDSENVKIQVLATDFMPEKRWVLDNINIVSDEEIVVTYASAYYSCEPVTADCYEGYRELVLKKNGDSFNILKASELDK